MASQLDSEAHFTQRAEEYGIPNALLANLRNNGVTTMGQLAFAILRPGSEYDEATFDNWVRTINQGAAPTLAAMTGLRRLHFESEVILTSRLKAQVESPDPSGPRPIPFAERAARMNVVRNRLTGLYIYGQKGSHHRLLSTKHATNLNLAHCGISKLANAPVVRMKFRQVRWIRNSGWMLQPLQ